MIHWILAKWRERQRSIDESVLWPAIKKQAPNLDYARKAFASHTAEDRAWRDLSEDEIKRRIDALT